MRNLPSKQINNPKKKERHRYGTKMNRITISISKGLLDMVDVAAKEDFTTRSDIIRIAILWYLRPQGRDLNQVDPTIILKTLKHRQARAGMKKLLKDAGLRG